MNTGDLIQIGEVMNNPPVTLLSVNQRKAQSDENGIDPREIDKVSSEVAGMIGRWNLFRKFIIEALAVNFVLPISSQRLLIASQG